MRASQTTDFRRLTLAGAAALALGLTGPAAAGDAEDAQPADGPTSGQTIESQVEYSWAEIRDFTVEQSEAAERQGEELVREMDEALDDLQRRSDSLAQSADAQADESWSQTMAALRDMRRAAAERADALGDASASAWDETKQGFRQAADAFAEAYQAAEGELTGAAGDKDDAAS